MFISKEWTNNGWLLTLFDKNKRFQSYEEAFVTLFGMVKYKDVSVKHTTSIRKIEE